jgi:hypothetical protein
MSIQADQRALEFIPAAELQAVVEACSTPLVREPIGESPAAGLAQVFKALADPVRLTAAPISARSVLAFPLINRLSSINDE